MMWLAESERPIMHILIVDDDEGIRETLALLLEEEGYEVQTVEDGQQAITHLHNAPVPTMILLDMMMPILDGPGVLAHLQRQSGMIEQHAWILMTAKDGDLPPHVTHLLHHWQIPLLRKPFDLEHVLTYVRQHERRVRQAETAF
jgi:DNA-binding response OmpR family regulator